MKPKLNTELINKWLNDNERSIAWLARQMSIDKPTMYYRMDSASLLDIEKLAAIVGIDDPRELIVIEDRTV